MVIFIFTMLFLGVFLFTRSYEYLERYYSTVLYVSSMSILYALICTNYGLWLFPIWWIFSDHASALLQTAILFPSTTVLFLRYLPRNKWFKAFYFIFFVVLYVIMEWIMLRHGEIRYEHGWNLGWSTLIDVLMFFMILMHENNKKITWLFTVVIITFFVISFRVPLFVL